MAKLRSVNTKFWDDPFVVELSPTEKLLFLYLITNSLTNILGVYEISLRKISFDTGINLETVRKGLERFERVRKVYFEEDYIILPNWLKNQKLNTNMRIAVEREFEALPNWLKNKIISNGSEGFGNGYQSILNGLQTLRKDEVEEEGEKEKENESESEDKILLSQVDVSTLNDTDKKSYQVAISFWELIKSNLAELDIKSPAIEKAPYKTWVEPIRLLIERDKRTVEEFREIFIFLQQDEFWKEQIRSTAKLRKKNKEGITYFEVLLTKARNEQKKQRSGKTTQSGVSEDYRRSILERLRNPKNSETVKEG